MKWGALDFDFFDNFSSSLVQALVAATHVGTRAGDFGHEDRLKESGFGLDLGGVHDSSGGWDDLSSASVNGIVMEFGIHHVVSAVSLFFVAEDTFFGDLLEGTGERILNIE